MIKRSDLVRAMTEKISNIAEVVGQLLPPDPVTAYIDLTPVAHDLEKAIYQMQPGQVMVYWLETNMVVEEVTRWSHRVEIALRAARDYSDMDLADLVIDGIPVPGDGMPWRFCALIPGVLPTNVINISRRTDSEGVDYHVILTETAETGDYRPLP